jgi:hypothetical protein
LDDGGRQFQTSLRHLANWLLLRSVQDHDKATTLTILDRKVKAMRVKNNKHDTVPTHDSDSHAESSNGVGE